MTKKDAVTMITKNSSVSVGLMIAILSVALGVGAVFFNQQTSLAAIQIQIENLSGKVGELKEDMKDCRKDVRDLVKK